MPLVAAQEGIENEVGHAAATRMLPAVFVQRIEQRAAVLRDNLNHPLKMPPIEVL